jgi:hypothetical protein
MFQWIALVAAIVLIMAVAGAIATSLSSFAPSQHQSAEQSREDHHTEKGHTTLWGAWFPDSISIFTFVLVAFTAALAFVGIIQLKYLDRAEIIAANTAQAAKDSADIAGKALVAANRPWVRADIQVGGPIFYNVNGANFTIKFRLTNIGRSPALNVWVSPQIFAPAIGIDAGRDLRAELQKIIAGLKTQPSQPFGFSLFPDETITQDVTVSICNDELKRITQKAEFIVPTIIGAIDYRSVLDDKSHQTGFIIEVRRSDTPRPESTANKRSPSAIFTDEGDVPASEVRLSRGLSSKAAMLIEQI